MRNDLKKNKQQWYRILKHWTDDFFFLLFNPSQKASM